MKNRHGVRSPTKRGTFFLLGALLTLGCGKEKPPTDQDVGEVHLALTLPDGTSINNVNWKVLSSTNAVVEMGMLNTAGNRSPSFISSLPTGTGYTVAMTATTDANVVCSGNSSAFDVTGGQATTVTVNILCSATVADGGTLGSVVVTGMIVAGDNCPALTGWFITPQSTTGHSPVDVSVTANDADTSDTLTYAWTATSGSFAGASSSTTTYACGATGSQTLTVAITDSHAPMPCTTTVMFPAVSCL